MIMVALVVNSTSSLSDLCFGSIILGMFLTSDGIMFWELTGDLPKNGLLQKINDEIME